MKITLMNGLESEIWIRRNIRLNIIDPVLELEIFLNEVDGDDLHSVNQIPSGKNITYGIDGISFDIGLKAPPGYNLSASKGIFVADDGEILPAIKIEALTSAQPVN